MVGLSGCNIHFKSCFLINSQKGGELEEKVEVSHQGTGSHS